MFGCAVREQPLLDFKVLNAEAMKRGYMVHPEVCTESVRQFIEQQPVNLNSTFYKRWQDVTDKSRWELFIDQICHYLTTYGTDFSAGNGYVPNDGVDLIPYKEYKTIMPVSARELADKCLGLLTAGIALKQDTMTACVECVAENIPAGDIDIDTIANREAQTLLCDKMNVLPNDKFALLRYIIYKTTGSTLVIKNRDLTRKIEGSQTPFDFNRLDEPRLHALASIFLRFKPLFLAFRYRSGELRDGKAVLKRTRNASVINRLRRLARKDHKPMPRQFWANVINGSATIDEVRGRLGEITLFKVVALMQLCKERLEELQSPAYERLYVIRNQKIYLRQYAGGVGDDASYDYYLRRLYAVLEERLVSHLRSKACPVLFPKDYQLALPATEKSFVGNMPFGTKYLLGEHNYIGIYWRNEWGTHDFDLSVVDERNQKYGWDANYYDTPEGKNSPNEIIFSGDMTNADPEATEVLYLKRGVISGMVYVNRYDGQQGSKFKLFIGQQQINSLTQSFMVDPNSVKLTVDMESTTGREQTVALIADNMLTLMEFTAGNARTTDGTLRVLDAMRRKARCFIELEPILLKAGFTRVEKPEELGNIEEQQILDLTKLDKSTLISLLR